MHLHRSASIGYALTHQFRQRQMKQRLRVHERGRNEVASWLGLDLRFVFALQAHNHQKLASLIERTCIFHNLS